jgi:hypothetical protein
MDKRQIQLAREIVESKSIPVTESGCWIWEGSGTYGRVTFGKNRMYAHRLAYAAFNGPVSSADTVTHVCHNPCCVNPEHLELATKK